MAEKQYMEMGKITNTHGIKGELKAQSWGDYEDDLLAFEYFYVGKDKVKMEVDYAKPHKNLVIMKLKNVSTCDDAEKLKNAVLYMDRAELEALEEGNYYISDLEGITAYLEDGTVLGIVEEILQAGGNDVLVIKNEMKKEFLVPFVLKFVPKVNIAQRSCVITPVEGLFDHEI